MKVLILGGIREAVGLAADLFRDGIDVTYSIAGLVRQPDLPCRVISGGFSRFGGLDRWARDEGIGLIVDATHPYAGGISVGAAAAAQAIRMPCWRYLRPPWEAGPGDSWQSFDDWETLLPALSGRRSVLFATGRPPQGFIDALHESGRATGQRQWLRSAVRPTLTMPAAMTWIEDIGPFTLEAEKALLNEHGVDAIVCKNSGGTYAAAKLEAARESGIPVYMLSRPVLPAVTREFDDIGACRRAIVQHAMEASRRAG